MKTFFYLSNIDFSVFLLELEINRSVLIIKIQMIITVAFSYVDDFI